MKKEKNWAALVLISVTAALKISLLVMLYTMHHEIQTTHGCATHHHNLSNK